MKTTVDLPDDLLIAAKKKAAETRVPLRAIFERALKRELARPADGKRPKRRKIRWLTSPGGLPPGLDVSDRERMWDWFDKNP
jgi:hypothetical protein